LIMCFHEVMHFFHSALWGLGGNKNLSKS